MKLENSCGVLVRVFVELLKSPKRRLLSFLCFHVTNPTL
jgi:hypothetical protein